jgi:hypothetical protein
MTTFDIRCCWRHTSHVATVKSLNLDFLVPLCLWGVQQVGLEHGKSNFFLLSFHRIVLVRPTSTHLTGVNYLIDSVKGALTVIFRFSVTHLPVSTYIIWLCPLLHSRTLKLQCIFIYSFFSFCWSPVNRCQLSWWEPDEARVVLSKRFRTARNSPAARAQTHWMVERVKR